MDFIKQTESLWNIYFHGSEDDNYTNMELFAPDCVVIGTGKHEIFRNLEDFSRSFANEMADRKDIAFQFKDLWCEQRQISPEVYLVYGGIFIWWESDDKDVFINMDSRFTILYKRFDDDWKITHIHHSVPNIEQKDGEYYPKTLSMQVAEERKKVDALMRLAQKDSLTDLINYRTFEELYHTKSREGAWIFVIDLDNFKNINDTYGHMEGNQVLIRVAGVLRSTVRYYDIVCRMGGDEFLLLCNDLHNETEAKGLLQRILKNIADAGKNRKDWVGVSIGGTLIHPLDTLETAFKRADDSMYSVKTRGKNGFQLQMDR